MSEQPRLQDRPDWLYLLRDYYELYRRLSAGGSTKIRSHQKTVRDSISRVIKANAEVHEHAPLAKPVTAHWRRALDNGRMERHAPFILSLIHI